MGVGRICVDPDKHGEMSYLGPNFSRKKEMYRWLKGGSINSSNLRFTNVLAGQRTDL